MAGHQGSSTRRIDIEALNALIDARLRDTRSIMKGTVGTYDPAKQQGTVSPSLTMTVAGKTITAPDVPSVPIIMPRGGGYGFHFPMKAGNALTLMAMDRPFSDWQDGTGKQNTGAGRTNDLSNIIALPGGEPDSKPMTGMGSDGGYFGSDDGKRGIKSGDDGTVALKGGPTGSDKLVITPAGKVDLKGENGDGLMQIIRDLATIYRDHVNALAPMNSPDIAAANAIIARIDAIKS